MVSGLALTEKATPAWKSPCFCKDQQKLKSKRLPSSLRADLAATFLFIFIGFRWFVSLQKSLARDVVPKILSGFVFFFFLSFLVFFFFPLIACNFKLSCHLRTPGGLLLWVPHGALLSKSLAPATLTLKPQLSFEVGSHGI